MFPVFGNVVWLSSWGRGTVFWLWCLSNVGVYGLCASYGNIWYMPSMKLTLCHASIALSFEVASRYFRNSRCLVWWIPFDKMYIIGFQFHVTLTDNDLRCGNKSSHHQTKTTVMDDRDEYFEGHSRQHKVRWDEKHRHPRTMQIAGGGKIC